MAPRFQHDNHADPCPELELCSAPRAHEALQAQTHRTVLFARVRVENAVRSLRGPSPRGDGPPSFELRVRTDASKEPLAAAQEDRDDVELELVDPAARYWLMMSAPPTTPTRFQRLTRASDGGTDAPG